MTTRGELRAVGADKLHQPRLGRIVSSLLQAARPVVVSNRDLNGQPSILKEFVAVVLKEGNRSAVVALVEASVGHVDARARMNALAVLSWGIHCDSDVSGLVWAEIKASLDHAQRARALAACLVLARAFPCTKPQHPTTEDSVCAQAVEYHISSVSFTNTRSTLSLLCHLACELADGTSVTQPTKLNCAAADAFLCLYSRIPGSSEELLNVLSSTRSKLASSKRALSAAYEVVRTQVEGEVVSNDGRKSGFALLSCTYPLLMTYCTAHKGVTDAWRTRNEASKWSVVVAVTIAASCGQCVPRMKDISSLLQSPRRDVCSAASAALGFMIGNSGAKLGSADIIQLCGMIGAGCSDKEGSTLGGQTVDLSLDSASTSALNVASNYAVQNPSTIDDLLSRARQFDQVGSGCMLVLAALARDFVGGNPTWLESAAELALECVDGDNRVVGAWVLLRSVPFALSLQPLLRRVAAKSTPLGAFRESLLVVLERGGGLAVLSAFDALCYPTAPTSPPRSIQHPGAIDKLQVAEHSAGEWPGCILQVLEEWSRNGGGTNGCWNVVAQGVCSRISASPESTTLISVGKSIKSGLGRASEVIMDFARTRIPNALVVGRKSEATFTLLSPLLLLSMLDISHLTGVGDEHFREIVSTLRDVVLESSAHTGARGLASKLVGHLHHFEGATCIVEDYATAAADENWVLVAYWSAGCAVCLQEYGSRGLGDGCKEVLALASGSLSKLRKSSSLDDPGAQAARGCLEVLCSGLVGESVDALKSAEEHASSDETPAIRPLMSFYREAVLFVSTSQLNGIICGAEMRAEDVFGFFALAADRLRLGTLLRVIDAVAAPACELVAGNSVTTLRRESAARMLASLIFAAREHCRSNHVLLSLNVAVSVIRKSHDDTVRLACVKICGACLAFAASLKEAHVDSALSDLVAYAVETLIVAGRMDKSKEVRSAAAQLALVSGGGNTV